MDSERCRASSRRNRASLPVLGLGATGWAQSPSLAWLCDAHRSHRHALSSTPAAKYFSSFWHPIPRVLILGMGVLASEKPSTWFTFLGLYLTSEGIPIHPNNVVAGKEVKVLPAPAQAEFPPSAPPTAAESPSLPCRFSPP